jgi:hypothetical protein
VGCFRDEEIDVKVELGLLANAAFDRAVKQFPNERLTLHGTLVMGESDRER